MAAGAMKTRAVLNSLRPPLSRDSADLDLRRVAADFSIVLLLITVPFVGTAGLSASMDRVYTYRFCHCKPCRLRNDIATISAYDTAMSPADAELIL